MITIWGLAAGRGTTSEAAYGAFTWRDYPSAASAKAAASDWKVILKTQDDKQR